MSATTPNFQLPYPLESDHVSTLPDILTDQAIKIDTLLAGFDFNGKDAEKYVARLTQTENDVETIAAELAGLHTSVASMNAIIDALGTVRTGTFAYDSAKISVTTNRLLRIGDLVFASAIYAFKSGVVTGQNAYVATVMSIPDGFKPSRNTRVSISHIDISPGADDAKVTGSSVSQWNINDSTSSYSLTGIWTTNDA